MQAFTIYLILINIITFFVYGNDKRRARREQWRIPERTLITLALLGGSAGALAGMYFFHHKTKKRRFRLGIPIILICQAALIIFSYSR